jgi:uncharacterized protein
MILADEKCLALTTYRRNGEGVTTPVWVVPVSDGRCGFYTSHGSGKTKRLSGNPRVTVQPCSYSGRLKPGTSPAAGTAEVVRSGQLFDEVQASVRKKYGFQARLARLMGGRQMRKQGLQYADAVVLIRLD